LAGSVIDIYGDGAILVEGSVCPTFMPHPFDLTLAETRFKIGSFTRDMETATGTQAITGVGFTPSSILFFGITNTTDFAHSEGCDNITSAQCIFRKDATSYESSPTESIYLIEVYATSHYYLGHVQSFDADGFTIAWTRGNDPVGIALIKYIAFR